MTDRLDTVRTVETPEGVELTLRVAGPVVRALAWALDLGIRSVLYAVASVLLLLGDLGVGIMFLVLFAGEWFYSVPFEVLRRGATPGKAVVGLVVLNDDGTPVGWTESIVRNLLRFADFLPFAYLIGLATMTYHRDFKRLGDIAAGTLVVYRDRPSSSAHLPRGVPVPVPVPLEVEEQRLVIEFAERAAGWSPERSAELAEIAAPIAGGSPAEAAERLTGMARWLLGQR